MSSSATLPAGAHTGPTRPGEPGEKGDGDLDRIRMEAAEWVVALAEEHPAPEELAHLHAAWCAQDARHRRVFDEIERLWHASTPELLQPAATAVANGQRKRRRNGRLKQAATGLAVVAVTAWAALQMPATLDIAAIYLADQRTAVGEVRQLRLDDGSTLTLNTHSAVDIDYTTSRRTLRLRAGEVLVQVASDGRPFEVLGRDGAVRALGTRYAVRQDTTDSRVTVAESQVQITPAQAPDAAVPLRAGQQARFDRHQVSAVHDGGAAALDWAGGMLVFNDAPLPEVLAELARYRPGVLRFDAARLQHLRFTGVLPTGNPREALSLLVDALPLRVTLYTDYLALVGPETTGRAPATPR